MDDNVDNHILDSLEILPPEFPDYSNDFITDKVFSSREDIVKWVRHVGYSQGFILIITKSDGGKITDVRKERLEISCEKSGVYKPYKPVLKLKTKSKKRNCPFKIYAKEGSNGWTVTVKCGTHNHDKHESLIGHPFAGRLTTEEIGKVEMLKKNMVKPRFILNTLREANPDNCTTIGQIYQFGTRFKRSTRYPRTQMQHLLKLLNDDGYETSYRKDDYSDVVMDIFWAHPTSLKLLNSFGIVLVMDNTYKTNRYHWPLLEIVGQTSTEKTFTVAFCYMEAEKQSNFIWALQQLKRLIKIKELPKVIVTDAEAALAIAIKKVFPLSTHLLCQFHINKNVRSKARKLLCHLEKVNPIMDAWCDVVRSKNEEDYLSAFDSFKHVCRECPTLIEYVQRTHLIPNKEKFVHAWIDKVMHLGNTTSNRVEGAHASLKKMLSDSKVDICTAFESMKKLLTFQISAITESFQTSILKVDHRVNVPLYRDLWGFVSHSALTYIADQVDALKTDGCGKCDCKIRITHGLPCQCELRRYTYPGKCIPLSLFDDHWRKLSVQQNDNVSDHSDDFDPQPLINEFLRQLGETDVAGKKRLLEKFRLLLYPETTLLLQPKEKAKTKGRPVDRTTKRALSEWEHQDAESDRLSQLDMSQSSQKVSSSISCRLSQSEAPISKKSKRMSHHVKKFPIQIQEHITDIGDVIGDGNCGFRAIAMYKFGNEEHYNLIRHELINEMKNHRNLYVKMLSEAGYNEVKNSLVLDKLGMAPTNKWLTLPDMGHVIVNRYNIILVSLAKKPENCTTYLPYISGSPAEPKIWVIGFVDNCHWIQVFLSNQAPLPRINLSWKHFRSDAASAWTNIIQERVTKYEKIFCIEK